MFTSYWLHVWMGGLWRGGNVREYGEEPVDWNGGHGLVWHGDWVAQSCVTWYGVGRWRLVFLERGKSLAGHGKRGRWTWGMDSGGILNFQTMKVFSMEKNRPLHFHPLSTTYIAHSRTTCPLIHTFPWTCQRSATKKSHFDEPHDIHPRAAGLPSCNPNKSNWFKL